MNNLFTAFHLSSLFERLVNFRNVFVTQNCSWITHSCRPRVNSSLKIFHIYWPLGSISEALYLLRRWLGPVTPSCIPTWSDSCNSSSVSQHLSLKCTLSFLPFQDLERIQLCSRLKESETLAHTSKNKFLFLQVCSCGDKQTTYHWFLIMFQNTFLTQLSRLQKGFKSGSLLAHPVSFAEPLPCSFAFPTQPSTNPKAAAKQSQTLAACLGCGMRDCGWVQTLPT